MESIPDMADKLKRLIMDLAVTNQQMAEMAPEMALPLRPLIGLSPEDIDVAIGRLLEKTPADQRARLLEKYVLALEGVKARIDLTKWRLDQAVQPSAPKPEFNSFCRRKPRW